MRERRRTKKRGESRFKFKGRVPLSQRLKAGVRLGGGGGIKPIMWFGNPSTRKGNPGSREKKNPRKNRPPRGARLRLGRPEMMGRVQPAFEGRGPTCPPTMQKEDGETQIQLKLGRGSNLGKNGWKTGGGGELTRRSPLEGRGKPKDKGTSRAGSQEPQQIHYAPPPNVLTSVKEEGEGRKAIEGGEKSLIADPRTNKKKTGARPSGVHCHTKTARPGIHRGPCNTQRGQDSGEDVMPGEYSRETPKNLGKKRPWVVYKKDKKISGVGKHDEGRGGWAIILMTLEIRLKLGRGSQ